ncbi:hypothetical protein I316_06059 [Kwoniella heveanensis BCC8398]|uniref:DUF7702 domain-containing protein n=1 Tax=Kwoniella heveanensis BCC8398 TaxID=1296120 RepID=A0A1B9GMS1_9TREE|nr:hypothetical protein I316_06059 [Kwoniella heveanensis BCC8398]
MSSTPSNPQFSAISNINFTGGFPTSKDLAPSIIFLILYVLAAPVLVYRLIKKESRTLLLFRPSIFLVSRIGMLVIRAYMSKNKYSQGLLIAELVLVSVGFMFLIEPAVGLWKLQVDSDMAKEDRPIWVRRLAMILKLAILAALCTALAGSGMISDALKNTDKLNTVKTLREASNVLSVAVVVVLVISTVLTHTRFHLDTRGTIFILGISANLLIVAVYRVVQTFATDPSAAARSLAAFWILQMVFEFFAFVMLIAIAIPVWFPGQTHREKRLASLNNNDIEIGQTRDMSNIRK